jgi:hypothetical protein
VDTTWTQLLVKLDDGFFDPITIPFTFTFYGTGYTALFINKYGNLSFEAFYNFVPISTFPNIYFQMLAPFLADVDTRGTATGSVYYKIIDGNTMAVAWVNVGHFSYVGSDKVNTFQVIISNGMGTIAGTQQNNACFCYGDMQWATGGENGFGGTPATVGANKGVSYG